MDRDRYRFRSKARIVAFVDLILSSMSLCICLIFFIALLRVSTMDRDMLMSRRHKGSSSLMEMELSMTHPDVNPKSTAGNGAEKIENTGNPNSAGNSEDSSNTGTGSNLSDPLDENDPEYPNKGRVQYLLPTDPGFLKLMWIFFALVSIMTGVQILAAIRLLNATQLGKDPLGALKLCRFWRLVCVFFTGLLVFNFLSTFRQRGENFLEVAFLLTNIIIRIVALYVVQQYVHELDMAIVTTLPIRRIHHPTANHLIPNFPTDNFAYVYGPYPLPSEQAQQQAAPPPKYEDVVKEPYKPNGEQASSA